MSAPINPGPITPTQIALVQATLPRLTQRPEQSAMAFGMHLARYAPALAGRVRFSPVALLAQAVAHAASPEALRAQTTQLAQSLRAAGLSPRGYMAIHAALMDMVCAHLGHDLELEEAYSDVIGMILAQMLDAAHGPKRHGMPLAA